MALWGEPEGVIMVEQRGMSPTWHGYISHWLLYWQTCVSRLATFTSGIYLTFEALVHALAPDSSNLPPQAAQSLFSQAHHFIAFTSYSCLLVPSTINLHLHLLITMRMVGSHAFMDTLCILWQTCSCMYYTWVCPNNSDIYYAVYIVDIILPCKVFSHTRLITHTKPGHNH